MNSTLASRANMTRCMITLAGFGLLAACQPNTVPAPRTGSANSTSPNNQSPDADATDVTDEDVALSAAQSSSSDVSDDSARSPAPSDTPTPTTDEPVDEDKKEPSSDRDPSVVQPAIDEIAVAELPGPIDASASATIQVGDWAQWGGTSYRNNTPLGKNIPTDWHTGNFDRKTGAWQKEEARNIKWVARVGSQTYGNPVVSGGRIYVGTNNGAGYLKRYPSSVDLGCLLCFRESDGQFLWQHSSEKLSTGRVHDWPLQGICCAPLVEENRVWFVTSRGHVVCADAEGYYDGEDDGPVQGEWARLFRVDRALQEGLADGQILSDLRDMFEKVGLLLPESVKVTTEEPGRKWLIGASVDGTDWTIQLRVVGPKLVADKLISPEIPEDKVEADTIWALDMMKELGVSQHNMCSCSVTAMGDILFVNTSNGLDESHVNLPAPSAPSFIAIDKNTGKVIWTDKSPGANILHGQWSSPTAGTINGVPQVIFAGGDGWIYSFRADRSTDGEAELLWKFDGNPKDSKWILNGLGTRNNVIATPIIHEGFVYVTMGQDPEHGSGIGHLWCIDPTRSGDVSPQLAVLRDKPTEPIPHKRIQAVVESEGEIAVPNPNSAAVWHYSTYDQNGDGQIDFEEEMHRSCGTVAVADGLLFISDFSGLFHCLDARTGKVHWSFDMLAQAWGSPLIVEGKVYIGDEDGDVSIFPLTSDRDKALIEVDEELKPALGEINMKNSVYSTPVVANNVLYIANKTHLFAIQHPADDQLSKRD